MNEADWQTGLAAVLGICGVALGFWWADALAGAVISLDIVRDGFLDVKGAISDLMDRRPQKLLGEGADPLPQNVLAYLERQDWIAEAAVRLREDGRLFIGEAFIVPKEDNDLTRRISAATKDCRKLDWRLSEFTIAPVPEIPEMVRRAQPAELHE